jgi:hypothetical protein
VPCRFENISRESEPDRFLVLLREHNRQRDKSFDEKLREEAITVNPKQAYKALIEAREKRARLKVSVMPLRDTRKRSRISPAKQPLLDAILKILEDFREYWPIGQRLVHYHLLDNPPLVHASKPQSTYQNQKRPNGSNCLSELITRGRIQGLIPEEAFEDKTRPVSVPQCWGDTREFIREDLEQFLKYYRRNLVCSQPHHIEVFVEKRAMFKILEEVTLPYCIPLSAGGGYSSYPVLQSIAERFETSGKEKLVLIILSDFDPDGEEIGHSFARNLRDDHRISDIVPVRAALKLEDIRRLNLYSSIEIKKKKQKLSSLCGEVRRGPEAL